MGRVRFHISVSLDGFVAGEHPSAEHPLGIGGMQLHEWLFALAAWRAPHGIDGGDTNASSRVVEEGLAGVGAVIMGRNMFGGGPGPWPEDAWTGWWGDNPPFHMPVFVLTHHAREPLELDGATTFTFVTDGIGAALEQARLAAAGGDVTVAGGAQVAQQYLAAGLVDDMELHVVPCLLGGGSRLFENLGDRAPRFEQVRAVEGPGVTHLRYRASGLARQPG
ncbi:MAG: dihydrofolate reductase family protein [Acidimicrobiales bacterium]